MSTWRFMLWSVVLALLAGAAVVLALGEMP